MALALVKRVKRGALGVDAHPLQPQTQLLLGVYEVIQVDVRQPLFRFECGERPLPLIQEPTVARHIVHASLQRNAIRGPPSQLATVLQPVSAQRLFAPTHAHFVSEAAGAVGLVLRARAPAVFNAKAAGVVAVAIVEQRWHEAAFELDLRQIGEAELLPDAEVRAHQLCSAIPTAAHQEARVAVARPI